MTAPWSLEHVCWRQFAAQGEDCKNLESHLSNSMVFSRYFIIFIIISIIYRTLLSPVKAYQWLKNWYSSARHHRISAMTGKTGIILLRTSVRHLAWKGLTCFLLALCPGNMLRISESDLLRHRYVLPHWGRSHRSNLLSHQVTVSYQSQSNPVTAGVWQGSHWGTTFKVTGMQGESKVQTQVCRSWDRHLATRPVRWCTVLHA